MSPQEFLNLITRYTEQQFSLANSLFSVPAEIASERKGAADALWQQIGAEIAHLHTEAAKSERRAITFGDIVHSQVLAMRAAAVASVRESPEAGMRWILNTLEGPGHLPDDEDVALGAQPLWDKETAEHEAFRKAHPAP